MTADQGQVLANAAKQAAAHYGRRFPWMDKGDFVQEAWAVMLPALRSFDPQSGDLASYMVIIALRACKGLACRFSAPASGKSAQALGVAMRDEMPLDLSAEGESAEEQLVAHQKRQALCEEVAKLLAKGKDAEAVSAILLGGEPASVVAERFGVSRTKVEKQASRVRVELRQRRAQLIEVL